MSLSTRSYSKESRSSSYYSRSASYHSSTATANNNNNSSLLSRSYTLTDNRPLSTRLIEREPIWTWNWDFDDPFWFDRVRWRLNWPLPVCYRTWDSSTSTTSRIIPVQYTPSTNRRAISYKKTNTNESTSNIIKHDESSMRKNRKFYFTRI